MLSHRLVTGRGRGMEAVFGEDLRYLLFASVIAFIFVVVKLIDVVVFDVFVSSRRDFAAPALLRELLSLALYAVLIAWSVSWIFHKSIRGLLATTTVVAAVLGLALQDTLANLFSGLSLHMEGSFEIGDVVRSGEVIGVVERVGWRSSHLRTFNDTLVVLPNSVLARERLEVFPRSNLNARRVKVGAGYEVPPAHVVAVLEQAAANVDGVATDPPCIARMTGFDDSSIGYEVKYWTRRYAEVESIDAAVRKAIWYAFRRHGISIPFPIRTLQRHAPQPQAPPLEPPDILGRLHSVDMLAPLSPEEHEKIARSTKVRRYARGETILRKGQAGDSMFLVHDGRVSVRIPTYGTPAEVAQLSEGAFFGEMALLTGEARNADVVCLTDVIALEIGKESLQPVLSSNPDLAAALSEKIVERRAAAAATVQSEAEEQKSIMARIRSYFGL